MKLVRTQWFDPTRNEVDTAHTAGLLTWIHTVALLIDHPSRDYVRNSNEGLTGLIFELLKNTPTRNDTKEEGTGFGIVAFCRTEQAVLVRLHC